VVKGWFNHSDAETIEPHAGKLLNIRGCRNEAIVNVDRLPADAAVPALGLRMRCDRCGQRGADVVPNWKERLTPTPITRSRA